MNNLSLKDSNSNKELKKSLSQKNSSFIEFNKKLEDFISGIESKVPINDKITQENNQINKGNINEIDLNKNSKIINIDNNNLLFNKNIQKDNKNNLEENQNQNSLKRLNLEKLIGCDQFAENYYLMQSDDYLNYDNNNFYINYDLPYSRPFDDNIMMMDESIFFIFDKEYKNKLINKEDIKKFKKEEKEEIKLNFGKDPFEIFENLKEGKLQPNDKTSIEFYNSLNKFNIFKSRNQNILNLNNINIDNTDTFNLINFHNCPKYNKQDPINETKNDSLNSSKENNKTIQKSPSIIINQKEFLFQNEKYLLNDNEQKKNDNVKRYKILGKKRKNKI